MIIVSFFTIGFLMSFVAFTKGTTCLICSERNEEECKLKGSLLECDVGDICATVVRRNGGYSSVTKRCKQREACLNDQKQNWVKLNSETYHCNDGEHSTCRCCCFDDHCNLNESCVAAEASQTSSIRCPELPEPFRFGTRTCSRGNRVGSICRVRCNSDYVVNPSYCQEMVCQPNGLWDKPAPCCSKPCPPNLFIDMVLIKHFHDHELVLSTIEQQLATMLSAVSVGPGGLRFALLHYDSYVHTPFIGFRETANLTSEQLLNLSLDEENLDVDLDSSVAYTGAALQFIHENLFNTEYDRPDAKNVIVLVTDQPSDDDVEPAAKALRESGVTIYSYYFKTDGSQPITDEEFYKISGFDDPRRIRTHDRTAAHPGFFENLCPNTCNAL